MFEDKQTFDQLNKKETAALIVDFIHRTMIHHALWYGEVHHQFGEKKALDLLHSASKKSLSIQLNHLGRILGFTVDDDIPSFLMDIDQGTLESLRDQFAKNWLANDGVWFQAVEAKEGMNDAKRCNDSCWARFSPFEAYSIKKMLGMDARPGLEGLKRALAFRVYAGINDQSIVDEGQGAFIFRMNDCRVQSARKRKGLADYPCKSAGRVEYKYFAAAIDERIETECIACPPDDHPEEWFCAWRFSLTE